MARRRKPLSKRQTMAVAVARIVSALDTAYRHASVNDFDLKAVMAAAYSMRLAPESLTVVQRNS